MLGYSYKQMMQCPELLRIIWSVSGVGWGILQRKKGARRAVTGFQPHKASYTVLSTLDI